MDRLKELPSESVHSVVTSPPYWGLRDYGHDDQIGMEPTPELYAEKIVSIAREIKRVLRRDGTFWLNLGDTYAASRSYQVTQTKDINSKRDDGSFNHMGMAVPAGLKQKDLVGIPWMVAFALRADGWFLRSDIIWAKPNPMPESVTDRPTKSHEYVFLLTKSPRYFFDAEAVKEPCTVDDQRGPRAFGNGGASRFMHRDNGRLYTPDGNGRNVRSVWKIATEPYNEAHFATFPKRLVERCVKAGTSEHGICAECGAPYVRDVTVDPMEIDRSERTHELGRTRSSGTMTKPRYSQTVGWKRPCQHEARTIPAVVLDPFSGSGTTGVVANNLGRDYIGIELNPEYVAMSERRLYNPQPSFMDALRDEYDLQNQQGFTE